MTEEEFKKLNIGSKLKYKEKTCILCDNTCEKHFIWSYAEVIDLLDYNPEENYFKYINVKLDRFSNVNFRFGFRIQDKNLFELDKDNSINLNNYPHKCPKCQGPAYIGFNSIDCSNGCSK